MPTKNGKQNYEYIVGKKLPSNRTYTVDDIAAILDIAKSTAYRLVNSREFWRIQNSSHRLCDPHFLEVI